MSEKRPKRGSCLHCDRAIFHGETLVFEEVTGFTKQRGSGGANSIHLRNPTGRLMCYMCMDRAKRGLIHQETLI